MVVIKLKGGYQTALQKIEDAVCMSVRSSVCLFDGSRLQNYLGSRDELGISWMPMPRSRFQAPKLKLLKPQFLLFFWVLNRLYALTLLRFDPFQQLRLCALTLLRFNF